MRLGPIVALGAICLFSAAPSRAETEPADPAVAWTLDISATAGKPTAMTFAPAGQFWEVAARYMLREGTSGHGFYVLGSPTTSSCIGRVKFEVEPANDRKLSKGAADFAAALPQVLKNEQLEVVGEVGVAPDAEPFTFGKIKLQGIRVFCTFRQPGATDRPDRRFCLVLQVGKAFVAVSTERYVTGADYLTTTLEAMRFAPPTPKPAPAPVKLLDMSAGIGRYLLATVPSRWTRVASRDIGDSDVVFERRDAKSGLLRSRLISIAQSGAPGFDLKERAENDAAEYAQVHGEVSTPAPRTVGDRAGFEFSFEDEQTEPGRTAKVRCVVVRRLEQRIKFVLTTWETDPKEQAADGAAMEEFLQSVKAWSASPK